MKKIFYLCILATLFYAPKVIGQYHITSHSWAPYADSPSFCNPPGDTIKTNVYAPGLTITTRSNDGYSLSSPVYNGGGYGYAICYPDFGSPGIYTLRDILYHSGTPVDSVNDFHEYLYCSTFIIKSFFDSAGTGIFDSAADNFVNARYKIEVGKNGVPIDTIVITGGLYYQVFALTGDVYSFKVISMPSGMYLTTPSVGIIYDTVQPVSYNYKTKYIGFRCSTSSVFDLAVNAVIPVTGINDQWGNIYVSNISCNPVNATVTMNFSPKYVYDYGNPMPTTVSGNTVTWNLTGVSAHSLVDIYYVLYDPAHDLSVGDTVQEHISVGPIAGDSDPTNNTEIIIDTVKAGCDPNAMWVSPVGAIAPGTQLKYTINFENTGNDTAFNISVYDTLSDHVDINSFNLVLASAAMNTAILKDGLHNIVKFDFPNINLLDSSHHGQCDGAVIFTVNAKTGLPNGTLIDNHAGIFFDYNPVVMTNNVENIINHILLGVSAAGNGVKTALYPNPATDELAIQTESGTYNTMTITNTIGQVLITQMINATQTKVDVHSLPAGIYYVTLRGDSGVKVMQFVKM